MKRGGCLTASLVLVQLLGFGRGVRRPAHTALAAFQDRSGQSYSVSRVTTWCPDENGNMRKVEKEVQKRGFFDGDKWRSGTTVTEWENGQKKTYQVEGDPELSKFPLPRTNLQRSLMADIFADPDPFLEMEEMLEEIFPRTGFFTRGLDPRIPSYSETLRSRGRPTRGIGYRSPSESFREAARTEAKKEEPTLVQQLQAGWGKVRDSASGLLGKAARGVGRGWRKLTGAVASIAESGKNAVCDNEAFQGESKTVEFRVSKDGKMEGKETVSNFVDGKWETVEKPLEAEFVEGFRAEKARRMTTGQRRAARGTGQIIDAEVES